MYAQVATTFSVNLVYVVFCASEPLGWIGLSLIPLLLLRLSPSILFYGGLLDCDFALVPTTLWLKSLAFANKL